MAVQLAPVREAEYRLETAADLDPLIEAIGDSRYVLLGEASHGTSEYYLWRARLSQRLIEEKGFSFICVEGDWPDCYRVNRYIKGYDDAGASAYEVLHTFQRWPTWMWANWEVAALVEWLRKHNSVLPVSERVGFYGLDVYSLWESMDAVLDYLQQHDPESIETAKRAYQCFEPYGEDAQRYAWATAMVPTDCENEVIDTLTKLRQRAPTFPKDHESAFNAEQNALVMVNGEHYYRAMIRSDSGSWNVRDRHMAETLARLMGHYGSSAKCIVWEHNTHIGDARATDMASAGMVNVGQLIRERERDVMLVGFGSYRGTVIAGNAWGAPMEAMPMPPAAEGSWEHYLHSASPDDRLILLNDETSDTFNQRRGHRAIGVVYHPDRERYGNYVPTVLADRYDAFIYLDKTQALHPLHIEPQITTPPELYPWGV
jgi:erythromycin esterase-like protein